MSRRLLTRHIAETMPRLVVQGCWSTDCECIVAQQNTQDLMMLEAFSGVGRVAAAFQESGYRV